MRGIHKRETYKHVIVVDSLVNENTYNNKIVYHLAYPLRGLRKMIILGGSIPATTEPYILVDIEEIPVKKVLNEKTSYVGILRYPLPAVTIQNMLDLNKRSSKLIFDLTELRTLTIKFHNRFGESISWMGNLSVASFSLASPTVITTTANHGLATNDEVYFREFDNATTEGKNTYINNTRFVATVTTPTQFTVPLDMTDQLAVSQRITSDQATYALGSKGILRMETGYTRAITLLSASGSDTIVHLGSALPVLSSGGNILINITGVDNCATQSDNNVINGHHYFHTVTDINLARTQVTLRNVSLSSYVTPQYRTLASAAKLLGLGSQVVVVKNQVCLDILFECFGDKQTIYNK